MFLHTYVGFQNCMSLWKIFHKVYFVLDKYPIRSVQLFQQRIFLKFATTAGTLSTDRQMPPNDNFRRDVARSSLDLDPLTERRKHLGEDDLLVPHRIVRVLLHAGATLQKTHIRWRQAIKSEIKLPDRAEGRLLRSKGSKVGTKHRHCTRFGQNSHKRKVSFLKR